MTTRWLYTGGVAAMGIGMALVYAAVVTRGVFVPGTLLILAGMIACAAGMVTDVLRHADEGAGLAAPITPHRDRDRDRDRGLPRDRERDRDGGLDRDGRLDRDGGLDRSLPRDRDRERGVDRDGL